MSALLKLNTIELFYTGSPESVDNQLAERYRSLGLKHPKFFKMNSLCKLGFLGCVALIESYQEELREAEKDQVATIFFNQYASIASDHIHHISLNENTLPSPAVFVYTLPNILNGEISIYYGWTGYNAFFVTDTEDESTMLRIIEDALHMQPFKYCIAGQVETDLMSEKYRARLSLFKVD